MATGGGSTFEVPVTLDTVPVYLRGGHIIARRERARRSTAAMQGDPLTLVSGRARHSSACWGSGSVHVLLTTHQYSMPYPCTRDSHNSAQLT